MADLPHAVAWAGDHIRLIDQRELPHRLVVREVTSVDELCGLIEGLAVRGAPALGVVGALGVALASVRGEDLDEAAARLVATRPTAVNLAWGVERARAASDPVAEAQSVLEEEVSRHRRIGEHGRDLVPEDARVLTHCNTGGLATVAYGSALGIVRAAHEDGRRPFVWVDETRPLLQGARLTTWELSVLGVPHRLVADAAAGHLLASGLVDLVLVGADRIAANGDVANKIGTYPLAVLAARHGVPFHVAAPTSTFDPSCPDGAAIPVEERHGEEVLELAGLRVAPDGVEAYNPAFDVTPAELVTSYVTEEGVQRVVPGS